MRFRLEPARARIGDRLTLTIDVDAPSIIESVQPRLEERLGDFDVLSIDSTPMAKGDGAWRQTWRVTLAAFDKGQPRVPRFALDYTAAGGLMLAYWADTGLLATITAPTVTADMPLRPIVGRQDPPPESPWPRIALIGGILSLVVGVASVPLVVWWLRTLRRRRQLAFFRQLQRELAKLGEAPTRTPDEARAAYTRAAEILRLGVGRVAPGHTSSLPSPDLANHSPASAPTARGSPPGCACRCPRSTPCASATSCRPRIGTPRRSARPAASCSRWAPPPRASGHRRRGRHDPAGVAARRRHVRPPGLAGAARRAAGAVAAAPRSGRPRCRRCPR